MATAISNAQRAFNKGAHTLGRSHSVGFVDQLDGGGDEYMADGAIMMTQQGPPRGMAGGGDAVDLLEDEPAGRRFRLAELDLLTVSAKMTQASWLQILDGMQILRHIACGLNYMHRMGIAHLDVKPSNILISVSY
jgi:hypothetical protein